VHRDPFVDLQHGLKLPTGRQIQGVTGRVDAGVAMHGPPPRIDSVAAQIYRAATVRAGGDRFFDRPASPGGNGLVA